MVNAKNECFIIVLKDRKDNFANDPKTPLINLAKNEIGRLSKVSLANINKELTTKLHLNQGLSSTDVMNWFEAIDNKHECKVHGFPYREILPINQEIGFYERSGIC